MRFSTICSLVAASVGLFWLAGDFFGVGGMGGRRLEAQSPITPLPPRLPSNFLESPSPRNPSANPQTPPAQAGRPETRRTIDLRNTKLPQINAPGEPMKSDNPVFRERYDELSLEERSGILIYENRNRSIVNIDTVTRRSRSHFFTDQTEGRGSGIVLTKDGIVLTNFHVVENANAVSVTLFDGQTFEAFIIGSDANTDIALLKIDAPSDLLFPVEFGDSSKLLVGQNVFAIGNPFGHERTMTRGIVSNLNRTIDSPQQSRVIKGVIQIDAAINPGNSGGALLDARGRMIGMNTAIASRVGENTGVGFAIPVNTIARIGAVLLEQGKVVRGDIGILQVSETPAGILPMLIENNGAADKAGLKANKIVAVQTRENGIVRNSYQRHRVAETDVITGVNGQKVGTGEEFITTVEEHKPGEKIELDILRNGKPMKLPVVLD